MISLDEDGDDWIQLTEIVNKTEFRSPVRIYLPEEYKGLVKRFRIEATLGIGGFVCISEVEFYQNGSSLTEIPDIFEDQAATRLKPGVTTADIEVVPNAFLEIWLRQFKTEPTTVSGSINALLSASTNHE